jgi:hypothetical protein
MTDCKIQRQQDEYFCSTCHSRWDFIDTPPRCGKVGRTIIALTGAAGSGKSTAARYLTTYERFETIKFAGALKAGLDAMLRYCGVPDHDRRAAIEGSDKETPLAALGGHTPRHAMQTLGTEWGREQMGQDFWVNMVRTAIENTSPGSRIIIDDVRFHNEAALIREMGGKVVMITGRGGIAGSHVSESGGIVPDVTIENTGDIALLHGLIRQVV